MTGDPTILPALYSRAAGQEGAAPKPGVTARPAWYSGALKAFSVGAAFKAGDA
jgi:hypothetical protein